MVPFRHNLTSVERRRFQVVKGLGVVWGIPSRYPSLPRLWVSGGFHRLGALRSTATHKIYRVQNRPLNPWVTPRREDCHSRPGPGYNLGDTGRKDDGSGGRPPRGLVHYGVEVGLVSVLSPFSETPGVLFNHRLDHTGTFTGLRVGPRQRYREELAGRVGERTGVTRNSIQRDLQDFDGSRVPEVLSPPRLCPKDPSSFLGPGSPVVDGEEGKTRVRNDCRTTNSHIPV